MLQIYNFILVIIIIALIYIRKTGIISPGSQSDIEVNQIAAGHIPGPWVAANNQVLIELRAKGSVYGWMNVMFSNEKTDAEKKEIVSHLQISS